MKGLLLAAYGLTLLLLGLAAWRLHRALRSTEAEVGQQARITDGDEAS